MKNEKKVSSYKISSQDLLRNRGEVFLVPCLLKEIPKEHQTEKSTKNPSQKDDLSNH